MDTLRRLRWNVALAATLALLLHSLMPVLMPAHAAARGSPADWVEVCTGGKVQLVAASALNANGASADPVKASFAKTALDDCASCSQPGTVALRSGFGREPPAASIGPLTLERTSDVRDPQLAWATAHTRSPPALN